METDKNTTAVPLKPADMVAYSDDAIVSRQLIRKDHGTISLFAFDKGQSLSEHTSPYDAFAEVLDGTAEFVIGGKQVTINRDESVILPADVPHSVNAVERFKMLLLMIKE